MSPETVDWSRIPAPQDDGAAYHLKDMILPDQPLPSTDGPDVSLGMLSGLVVVFAYPLTARPDRPVPEGWDQLPGAKGCTPQACAYRDRIGELQAAGVADVYGLSTQSTAWQLEAKERLGLPFPLLSDAHLRLQGELNLPIMQVEGETLLRRLTMILRGGKIEHVHYPVFPPDKDVEWVLERLREA